MLVRHVLEKDKNSNKFLKIGFIKSLFFIILKLNKGINYAKLGLINFDIKTLYEKLI